jgi:hypothetical protein
VVGRASLFYNHREIIMTIIYRFREKRNSPNPAGHKRGDLACWLGDNGDCDEEEVKELYEECVEGTETNPLLQAKEVAEAHHCFVTEEAIYVPRNSELLFANSNNKEVL